MKLARLLIGIAGRLREQKRAIERVSKSHGCGNIAFQGGNYASYSSGLAGSCRDNTTYGEGNANNPIQVGEARCVFEVGNEEGQRGHLNLLAAQYNHAGIQSINNLGHRFTLGLKARFGRACRAFVNAWRAP